MDKQTIPTTKHARANAAYLKGNYKEAVALQVELINDRVEQGKDTCTSRKLLSLYLYSAGDCESAVKLLKSLQEEFPEDSDVPENIGVMLRQLGKKEESVEYLLTAHRMSPEKFNVCDALAHCYQGLNQPENVQKFGRLSLELKDSLAGDADSWPIPDCSPPEFDYNNRDRNIISFSLFGDNVRYLHGAQRNAELAADLYPGWTCRFYCDPKVPKKVIKKLRDLDCQIQMRPAPKNFYEGLLWRFEVIDDPTVDRFLVRDCDSVINIKERVAVDEWLASDKWFHMMRDYGSHTELVLAGMWGGISGVLPPLKDLQKDFNPGTAATRTYDQHLLRSMVWPTIRQSVLIHDSVFTGCLGSVPFPACGKLPPNRHVGQNEAAVIDRKKLIDGGQKKRPELERFFLFGQPCSGTLYLQQLINAHPEANCPPEHHLSTIWKSSAKLSANYQDVIRKVDSKNAGNGHDIDPEKIRRELYETWLEHLFVNYADESISHTGINDNRLDANLPYHAAMFPKARFVFIARDPRQVTVSVWRFKKENDPGFDRDGTQLTALAASIGKEWSEKIHNVQDFSQTLPGRIELVRYEDLLKPESRSVTLKRIFDFLELPADPETLNQCFETVEAPGNEEQEWTDALSLQQIDYIQQDAGDLMKLLQYDILEVDQRKIDSNDTILPS